MVNLVIKKIEKIDLFPHNYILLLNCL